MECQFCYRCFPVQTFEFHLMSSEKNSTDNGDSHWVFRSHALNQNCSLMCSFRSNENDALSESLLNLRQSVVVKDGKTSSALRRWQMDGQNNLNITFTINMFRNEFT